MAEIRVAARRQWRRDADQDHVGGRESQWISGCLELPQPHQLADRFGGNLPQVAFTGLQALDLGAIAIEPQHAKASFGQAHGNGQPDVA